MRPRGTGHIEKHHGSWRIGFYDARGKLHRETFRSKREAESELRKRLVEVENGRSVPDRRTTFDDLERFIVSHYRLNERRSLESVTTSFRALRRHFSGYLAREIGPAELREYAAARRGEGRKPATVRRELALLRKAFRLGEEAGKVACPIFPRIEVQNARTGFFERDQWNAVRRHLPEAYQAVGDFAYLTGWRIMEILTLAWSQVDFEAGTLRLEPGTTKSGEGRTFPFAVLTDLRALLVRQREATEQHQRTLASIFPCVFHEPSGEPLFGSDRHPKKAFRKAWRRACELAGLPGKLPHDFRRTAVRNLVRAGVSEKVAMTLTGHKTRSVFDRYDIVSEADLARGVALLADFHAAKRTIPSSIPKRRTDGGNNAV